MQVGEIHQRHVFISYSHHDLAFVNRLRYDLQAQGIYIWIDHENLTPGTVDWEASVRKGIKSSQAIIYLASPNAIQSVNVKDELNIARDAQVPVFPFWISGVVWSDAAPIGWGMSQYIDARNEQYPAALAKLLTSVAQQKRPLIQNIQPAQSQFQIRTPYYTPTPAYQPVFTPVLLKPISRISTRSKWALTTSLAVFIIAAFLPWYSTSYHFGTSYYSQASINAFDLPTGIPSVLISLVMIVFIQLKSPQIPKYFCVFSGIVQLISIIFFLYSMFSQAGSSENGISSGPSSGSFIALLASLATIIIGTQIWLEGRKT